MIIYSFFYKIWSPKFLCADFPRKWFSEFLWHNQWSSKTFLTPYIAYIHHHKRGSGNEFFGTVISKILILLYLFLITFYLSSYYAVVNYSAGWVNLLCLQKTKLKLHGLSPWANCTDDRRLSLKLVPTFADRECHMVSVTDPYGRILGFLDRHFTFNFIIFKSSLYVFSLTCIHRFSFIEIN
jgi:hypothetical protein